MGATYEFLKDCGVFFLATVDTDAPTLRPFGAIMEYENELYISTGNTKDVYAQLIANPKMQIAALKSGTRDWVRTSGKAIEVKELSLKQIMLDSCPVLLKRFKGSDDKNFAMFRISEAHSSLIE